MYSIHRNNYNLLFEPFFSLLPYDIHFYPQTDHGNLVKHQSSRYYSIAYNSCLQLHDTNNLFLAITIQEGTNPIHQ